MAGSIDQEIKRALSVGPVSAGDDLVGFLSDVYGYLEQCEELFASVEVTITNDPHCVLEASCVVVDDAASDDTVASTLERIWLDYLRYGAEEAHALGSDREGVSLRFMTRSGPAASDLCVTGRKGPREAVQGNGVRRAMADRAFNVLFLCTGNSARSIMAEAV